MALRVVALLSGGKDSIYNAMECCKNGHKLVAVANLHPPGGLAELDSYMYQTVGHEAIELISQCLELPLFRAPITGGPINQDLDYIPNEPGDEVEHLYHLLSSIKEKMDFDAVSVGAIASSYQSSRVENICQRLNIQMLAYLWNRDQDDLLQLMIDEHIDAILIKVACLGLNQSHIGKSIKEMQSLLRGLHAKYDTNICGEGGEYETLVLDCPLFKNYRLHIDESQIVCHSSDDVYFMKLNKLSLKPKHNKHEELYSLALEFYKHNEGKAFHASLEERNQLNALILQARYGNYTDTKMPDIGVLDLVGRNRRYHWSILGDMSQKEAKQKFLDIINSLCPLFEVYAEAVRLNQEVGHKTQQRRLTVNNNSLDIQSEQYCPHDDYHRSADDAILDDMQTRERRERELQIFESLCRQTDVQFSVYARNQYPLDVNKQKILIKKLQHQHFNQYMQYIFFISNQNVDTNLKEYNQT